MKENSIEKDEEILNNIKAYMQENIDNGCHKFVYNDLGYDEKCVDVINAIEHILSDYKKLQKENEELKSENRRLKVIRYSTEYGTENIHLITKSDLVEINTNKYFIEIQDGKFVDLKQVYQENEELKEDLKYVLNQTLGAFEKNWCIDWNFTEIREKYNLESE